MRKHLLMSTVALLAGLAVASAQQMPGGDGQRNGAAQSRNAVQPRVHRRNNRATASPVVARAKAKGSKESRGRSSESSPVSPRAAPPARVAVERTSRPNRRRANKVSRARRMVEARPSKASRPARPKAAQQVKAVASRASRRNRRTVRRASRVRRPSEANPSGWPRRCGQ